MLSGELIVMGTDLVQIELAHRPVKVDVAFSDRGNIFVPCNPHYNDQLDWTVSNSILTIKWNVSGIREIQWKIWFYWSEVNS